MLRKYLWALTSSGVLVMAGVALAASPFVLYQRPGAWSAATATSFWSGIGILALGILGGLGFAGELARQLGALAPEAEGQRERATGRKPEDVRPIAPKPVAEEIPLDSDEVLRKLAAAVLRDLEEHI
jgi:hypothetical protein